MKAFQLLGAGGLLDGNFGVNDVAVPSAGVGEVVVKVKSASSHPVDYKMAGVMSGRQCRNQVSIF